ncbi:hypothetical protein SAMN04488137_4478 [Fictibacillus solisalsi]|uniref:Uncharacterized protein n=1 Tax=Fictibacillus solisalsi TaxID=459525 RepID=A0A1H0BD72_9BACL|nr:hypothetical protein [Fictibacillus solisalsi]SDN43577.1 hypothetical protein SAMN04488137_4478 [Fictibacillus solisalsi]
MLNYTLNAKSNQFYYEGKGQLSIKTFRNGALIDYFRGNMTFQCAHWQEEQFHTIMERASHFRAVPYQ